MTQLGNGLSKADHYEEALSVREAELSMLRRLGSSEANILLVMSNIATTYHRLGRHEEALSLWQDIYSSWLNLCGEENKNTLEAAGNWANLLIRLRRFEEAKALLRKTLRVARRVRGDNDDQVLRMRSVYAVALYQNDSATLDDLREAVATLTDTERIARRVFGGAHPNLRGIEILLREARAALRGREGTSESPSGSGEKIQ